MTCPCTKVFDGCLAITLQNFNFQLGPHPISLNPRSSFFEFFTAMTNFPEDELKNQISNFLRTNAGIEILELEFGEIPHERLIHLVDPLNINSKPSISWYAAVSVSISKRIVLFVASSLYGIFQKYKNVFIIQPVDFDSSTHESVYLGLLSDSICHMVINVDPETFNERIISDDINIIQIRRPNDLSQSNMPNLQNSDLIAVEEIINLSDSASEITEDIDNEFEGEQIGEITNINNLTNNHNQNENIVYEDISLQYFLNNFLSTDNNNNFTLPSSAYFNEFKIDFNLSESISLEENLLDWDITYDIDGIFAIVEPDNIQKVFNSNLNILYKPTIASKRDIKSYRKLTGVQNHGLRIIKIGNILNSISRSNEIFCCYTPEDGEPDHLVSLCIDYAMTFPCHTSENHRISCTNYGSQSLSNRPVDRTVTGRVALYDTISLEIQKCFFYHFLAKFHQFRRNNSCKFYIKIINSKSTLVFKDADFIGNIDNVIKSIISPNHCDLLFFDICKQLIPKFVNNDDYETKVITKEIFY
jgi:hypothetical protein